MPRRYRGMDTFWWLNLTGAFDRTIDDVVDPASARREPSLQLVGTPDQRTLDLSTLQRRGVRLTGRLAGIDGTRVALAGDLPVTVRAADQQMRSVLRRIDKAIDTLGLTKEVL